jgi:hypothetical protein
MKTLKRKLSLAEEVANELGIDPKLSGTKVWKELIDTRSRELTLNEHETAGWPRNREHSTSDFVEYVVKELWDLLEGEESEPKGVAWLRATLDARYPDYNFLHVHRIFLANILCRLDEASTKYGVLFSAALARKNGGPLNLTKRRIEDQRNRPIDQRLFKKVHLKELSKLVDLIRVRRVYRSEALKQRDEIELQIEELKVCGLNVLGRITLKLDGRKLVASLDAREKWQKVSFSQSFFQKGLFNTIFAKNDRPFTLEFDLKRRYDRDKAEVKLEIDRLEVNFLDDDSSISFDDIQLTPLRRL